MGIAIAIFVIPAFLVVAALSIWLACRYAGLKSAESFAWKKVLLNVLGIFTAITLTLFATWWVPTDHNAGWGQLFTRIGVVVLGPLVIGLTLLALRLVTRIARPVLTSIAAGALLASIPTLFVVPFALWYYQDSQYRSAYDTLCKHAFVEFIEPVNRANSVAFLPDLFAEPPKRSQSEIGGWAGFILNQSYLEYVERPATVESGLKERAQFEHIRTEGKRFLSGNNPNSERTKVIYEPTDTITAEYVVRPEILKVDNSQEFGLGGARITIHRREDNKLISRAQYYWSNKLFLSCPLETRGGLFVYHFIAKSLDVKNPEGPQYALPQ